MALQATEKNKDKVYWDVHVFKYFILFTWDFFCFVFLHTFFLFFPTAGATLCVSEGERAGVQGALQDGKGVPQGGVRDCRPRGAKVSPCDHPQQKLSLLI